MFDKDAFFILSFYSELLPPILKTLVSESPQKTQVHTASKQTTFRGAEIYCIHNPTFSGKIDVINTGSTQNTSAVANEETVLFALADTNKVKMLLRR